MRIAHKSNIRYHSLVPSGILFLLFQFFSQNLVTWLFQISTHILVVVTKCVFSYFCKHFPCYYVMFILQARSLHATLTEAKEALLDGVANTLAPGEEPIVVETSSSMVQVRYIFYIIVYYISSLSLLLRSQYRSVAYTRTIHRDHFVNAPSQWETTLQRNVVSHWLGAYPKWSLL